VIFGIRSVQGIGFHGHAVHITEKRFLITSPILKINIETGEAQNLTTKNDLDIQPLSDYVLDILRSGGIKPLVKRHLHEMQT